MDGWQGHGHGLKMAEMLLVCRRAVFSRLSRFFPGPSNSPLLFDVVDLQTIRSSVWAHFPRGQPRNTTSSCVGEYPVFDMYQAFLTNGVELQSGGTAGCVVAGRLAEIPGAQILLIEAGQHNENLENTQMAGG